MAPRKTWDKMASCPTDFHRFSREFSELVNNSSENVGQDGILSHGFSSFQGDFHLFRALSVANAPLQSTGAVVKLRPVDRLETQRGRKIMNAGREYSLLSRQSGY